MNRQAYKGSITVFLSISCIVFLALICAAVESARIQGAKAQAANIMGMGNFSLLGEFETKLLERYNIFALDGAYGSGGFKTRKIEDRLKNFLTDNADPKKNCLAELCFDPWHLELVNSKLDAYALLTDDDGEPFYQQAVAYMKTNLGAIALDKLLEYAEDADLIKTRQKEYEEEQKANDSQMSGLEDERQRKIETIESEAASSDGETAVVPVEPQGNPLKEIAKLRKKSVLKIVTWDKKISEKSLGTFLLPSRRRPRRGNLELEEEHGGFVDDVLFREYLMLHFPNYLSKESGAGLDYQLEYLLGGKKSDEGNLKYVVNRLLLIREGMNYLYCVQDPQMNGEAGGLALTLTGFLGIPALTSATKHALLLAWAFGESLVDVRVLLDDGKVPILKDGATWSLSLENLGRITEILQEGAKNREKGCGYSVYLRILLNLGSLTKQKMRALDLIQTELQTEEGYSEFKAENCIVAVRTSTSWSCHPVFTGLPGAVMGASAGDISIKHSGSIAY